MFKNTNNSFTTDLRIRQSCKKVRTSQETCPYSDWLVSILNFEEVSSEEVSVFI